MRVLRCNTATFLLFTCRLFSVFFFRFSLFLLYFILLFAFEAHKNENSPCLFEFRLKNHKNEREKEASTDGKWTLNQRDWERRRHGNNPVFISFPHENILHSKAFCASAIAFFYSPTRNSSLLSEIWINVSGRDTNIWSFQTRWCLCSTLGEQTIDKSTVIA